MGCVLGSLARQRFRKKAFGDDLRRFANGPIILYGISKGCISYTPVSACGEAEMVSTDLPNCKATRALTDCLLRSDAGDLSPVMVYRLIAKGFELKNVREMLSMSVLYSTNKILSRVMGLSVRTLQRRACSNPSMRLTSQQSTVAFQYARVLDQATSVFGTQVKAEDWLSRSCNFLDGKVPLDVIDNAIGFQAVAQYLERIEYGVYQ